MSYTTFKSFWFQVGPKFAMEMAKDRNVSFAQCQLWSWTILYNKGEIK